MTNDRSAGVPRWVRVAVRSIALSLAVPGVLLAVVLSSFWPLVAVAGLALPMLSVGRARPPALRAH